ncbi:ORF49 [Lymantria xylina nucleopolyhedrovirus]|uniref:ORF49 n=1 Tax=Lymantria xylina multiple nucleopolyhedrovirus TaxID=2847840 RepID=D4N286_9ABAC|nr:ORF49 [Lymantria xylina nucleopolyhedrovirus]ADD73758.1 ORF49 [Lymantria xylina nucleopolyhedrovirus]
MMALRRHTERLAPEKQTALASPEPQTGRFAAEKRKSQTALAFVKPPKLSRNIATLDLNAASLYRLLNLDEAPAPSERQVRLAFESLVDYYSRAEPLRRLFRFARDALLDPDARSVYDEHQFFKNNKIKAGSLTPDLDAIETEAGRLRSELGERAGDRLAELVETATKKPPPLRRVNKPQKNVAFNRVLVEWYTRPDNRDEVDEPMLREHFATYGEINALVLCNRRPGCALLEFASSESVTRAKNDDLFKVSDLTESTFVNQEFEQQLGALVSRVQSAEQQLERRQRLLAQLSPPRRVDERDDMVI